MPRSATLLVLLLPMLMASHLAMGRMRLEKRQWRLATVSFRTALEKDPTLDEARVGLGRAQAGMGKCESALEWLEAARQTPAWSSAGALAEADCSQRLGDLARAEAAYDEAMVLQADLAVGWYQQSLLNLRVSNAGGFEQALTALDAHPRGDNMVALLAAWRALEWGQGDLDQHLRELADQLALNPTRAGRAQLYLLDGLAWLDLGDEERARHALAEGNRLALNHLRLNAYLAEAHRRAAEPNEALQILDRRVIAVMESSLLDAIRGRILVDLGELEAAKRVVSSLDAIEDAEVIATRWYLARATSDPEADLLGAQYRTVVRARGRTLERLHPREVSR